MAEFEIDVIVDPSGARRGGRAVRGELNRVQRDADALRKTLVRTFAVLATGALLVGSIRLLADFSQSMSTVQAVTGATEEQFKSLREEALKLGATTRFSATEAGDAMVFLGRAGFDANEILKATANTLLLAQAGALDLGSAADIASNVLKGFRLEVEDLNEVVDVLSFTANNSNTTVSQLGQAMSFVAPIASGLGVSVQETSAAIGALSDAGIQATRAGTGLTRVLSELESPTAASQKILAQLGLTTNDVRVSQIGLTEVLSVLRDAGVDTGLALQLFGVRGGPAFEVLSNAIPDIKEMTEALGDVEGVARRTADIMDMNLNGALLALRSSIQNVVLQFGELSGQSSLTTFVRGLTGLFRTLAENLDDIGRAATVVGVALAVAFAERGVLVAVSAVRRLGIVLATTFGPITPVILAVTVALAFFADEISIGEGNLASLSDIASVVFDQIAAGFEIFAGVVESVFINLNILFNGFFDDIDFSFVGLLRTAARTVDRFVGFFIGLGRAIVELFFGTWDAVSEQIIDFINSSRRLFESFVNSIIGLLNTLNRAVGIPEIDEVQVEQRVNEFRGAGIRLVDGFFGAFEDSSGFDGFAEGLEATIAQANDLARQRAQASAGTGTNTSTNDDGTGVGTGGTGGTGVSIRGQTDNEFERLISQLQQENDLITSGTRERELSNAVLSAESILKRELNPIEENRVRLLAETNIQLRDQSNVGSFLDGLRTENMLLMLNGTARNDRSEILRLEESLVDGITEAQREEAKALIELNRELQDQAEIFAFLKGPQEDYIAALDAVNKLVEQGTISINEQNQALLNTQLGGAVSNVQTSLLSPEDAETERLQASLTERQLIIEQAIEARVLTEEEGNLIIQELNQQTQDAILNSEKQRAALQLGAASDTFNSLGQIASKFAGEQSDAAKVLFGISKAFAIAEATVKISQGVASALSLGFPAGIVAAAAVAAQAAGLIQTISGVQFEGGFQSGGDFMVGGSGGTDSQSVSFQATPGERVTVETPQQQASSDGAAPQSGQSEGVGVRIINVIDPAMVEGFLTSSEGEKVLLNVIERNSGAINSTLQA